MATPRSRCRACWLDYARHSSVHGLRRIATPSERLPQRLFWALVMLLSLGLCSQQIYNMWLKWTYAPVIVSFDERSTPVWEIPFPAVTICSETKARQTIFNFTLMKDKFQQGNITNSEFETLSDVSLLCEETQFVVGKEFTTDDVIHVFKNVSPSLNEILAEVSWCKEQVRNSEIFTPIVIGEGICYTYNMLDPKEIFTNITEQYKYNFTFHGRRADTWSMDRGYAQSAAVDTYPRRALGSGFSNSLVVLLRSFTKDIDFMCKGPVSGFRVLLHNPSELPWVSQHFLRSDLNQELVVAVRPHMMVTNQGLQQYSPYVRQCFFPFERELKYFRVYTQNNCQQECLANFTLLYCGCVGFYMPRTAHMRICGSGKRSCMTNAAREKQRRDVERKLHGRQLHGLACDCLAACTDTQYHGETSSARLFWRETVAAGTSSAGGAAWRGANIGRVVVFFKDSHFVKYIKSEGFGATEFWANCGGLLGLFLGMSILSVLEIVYFLTVRMWLEPINKRRN